MKKAPLKVEQLGLEVWMSFAIAAIKLSQHKLVEHTALNRYTSSTSVNLEGEMSTDSDDEALLDLEEVYRHDGGGIKGVKSALSLRVESSMPPALYGRMSGRSGHSATVVRDPAEGGGNQFTKP